MEVYLNENYVVLGENSAMNMIKLIGKTLDDHLISPFITVT